MTFLTSASGDLPGQTCETPPTGRATNSEKRNFISPHSRSGQLNGPPANFRHLNRGFAVVDLAAAILQIGITNIVVFVERAACSTTLSVGSRLAR